MMDVGRLQKFDGKITAQGKLQLHGPVLCTEYTVNPERNTHVMLKPRELQVFVFEQNIIFSEIVGKKTKFTNPSYIYRSHVQVSGFPPSVCVFALSHLTQSIDHCPRPTIRASRSTKWP